MFKASRLKGRSKDRGKIKDQRAWVSKQAFMLCKLGLLLHITLRVLVKICGEMTCLDICMLQGLF